MFAVESKDITIGDRVVDSRDGSAYFSLTRHAGENETSLLVRTFVPFDIDGETHLLAAYTCTPLVKFPLAKIEPGVKLKGSTVAELGGGNAPSDIVSYEQDDERFLLIANTRHGVLKVLTDGIAKDGGITERVQGTAGLEFETIDYLQGTRQMDRFGEDRVLVLLAHDAGGMDLETIALP